MEKAIGRRVEVSRERKGGARAASEALRRKWRRVMVMRRLCLKKEDWTINSEGLALRQRDEVREQYERATKGGREGGAVEERYACEF